MNYFFKNGSKTQKASGVRIALNYFSKKEVQLLANFLTSHYNLKTSIHLGKKVLKNKSRGNFI